MTEPISLQDDAFVDPGVLKMIFRLMSEGERNNLFRLNGMIMRNAILERCDHWAADRKYAIGIPPKFMHYISEAKEILRLRKEVKAAGGKFSLKDRTNDLKQILQSLKKASPKKASPKKASPKKASPKKASPKKASPKKASPKTSAKTTPKMPDLSAMRVVDLKAAIKAAGGKFKSADRKADLVRILQSLKGSPKTSVKSAKTTPKMPDLSAMKVVELKAAIKAAGGKFKSADRKADLVRILQSLKGSPKTPKTSVKSAKTTPKMPDLSAMRVVDLKAAIKAAGGKFKSADRKATLVQILQNLKKVTTPKKATPKKATPKKASPKTASPKSATKIDAARRWLRSRLVNGQAMMEVTGLVSNTGEVLINYQDVLDHFGNYTTILQHRYNPKSGNLYYAYPYEDYNELQRHFHDVIGGYQIKMKMIVSIGPTGGRYYMK